MTREEMRDYVRANPIDWPALDAAKRMRLAALLRPDLPIGIRRNGRTQPRSASTQGAA